MKFRGQEVHLYKSAYRDNNRLAVLMAQDNELYGVITVNIDEEITNDKCAFIDTNNFGDNIIDWLKKNKLGKETGNIGFSGYCIYPEFEFDLSKIKERGENEQIQTNTNRNRNANKTNVSKL